MDRFFIILFFILSTIPAFGIRMEVDTNDPQSVAQAQALLGQQTGAGKGCFESMLEGTGQGLSATLEAQNSTTQTLIGISKSYMDHEQSCGNQLAEPMMELTNAEADHTEKAMQLPAQIELLKLEYQEALLKVEDDCRNTSGEVYQKWKLQEQTGVLLTEDGGPQALFGQGGQNRDQVIASYQKLFYDDCLAQDSNLKRVDILARKLNANVQIAQAAIDASSMKLASLSKNLSFKQAIIVDNCAKAKKQLDYQSQLARNMASSTQSATKTKNFLSMLNNVNICIGGVGNSLPQNIDVTGAGTSAEN